MMSINTYQVQNILRTYGKQLGRARKPKTQTSDAQNASGADKIDVSHNAKRRQVISKIAQEIISQITTQTVQERNPLEKDALEQLSQEYGRPLEVFRNSDGSLTFAEIDPIAKKIIKELPSEQSQKLNQRFEEITGAIVNQNMIS